MVLTALVSRLSMRARPWGNTIIAQAVSACLLIVMLSSSPLYAQSQEQEYAPVREYHLGEENKLEIKVNVWGEVSVPGAYRVPDNTNLVELISLAGGPTDYANLGKVKITRLSGDGEKMIKVNLHDYLDGESNVTPIVLLPGDTIRVPRNAKHAWRSAIQVLSDVAVIATLYVLIHDRRYR